MFVVISPAKNLNETLSPELINMKYVQSQVAKPTIPFYIDEAQELISLLRKLDEQELMDLMGISHKLASLNMERYKGFSLPFTPDTQRCAVFFFQGDVYKSLDAATIKSRNITYMQNRLRIISGLFGLLKPLDLIPPYRLEMGSRLKNKLGRNLYEFWGNKITSLLAQEMEEASSKILVNLASNEYFTAINPAGIPGEIIIPTFKDYKNGQYKVIWLFAKKARGMMARFIVENRLSKAQELSNFAMDGYYFSSVDSTPTKPVFLRKNIQAA